MTDTAMVLAAGKGTRMRPLTATTPKPLIEVQGRALIDHVFDRLEAGGVNRFVVNVHYLADLIDVHVKRRAGERVTVSNERDALLDTGGGIKHALPLLGDGPFLVVNADTFWLEGTSATVRRMADAFDPVRMGALLLVAPTVKAVGYKGLGDFILSPDGRLARRPERVIAPFVYAGCMITSARAFADTPDGPFSLNLVFDRLIEGGALFGLRLDGIFLHVGTPDAIGEAERAIAESTA